jgi:hypothetical protein
MRAADVPVSFGVGGPSAAVEDAAVFQAEPNAAAKTLLVEMDFGNILRPESVKLFRAACLRFAGVALHSNPEHR